MDDLSLHIRLREMGKNRGIVSRELDYKKDLSRWVQVSKLSTKLRLVRLDIGAMVATDRKLKSALRFGRRPVVHYNVFFRGVPAIEAADVVGTGRSRRRNSSLYSQPPDALIGPTSIFYDDNRLDDWFFASCNDITFRSTSALPKLLDKVRNGFSSRANRNVALCLLGDQIYADALSRPLRRVYELMIPAFVAGEEPKRWRAKSKKLWSAEAYHAAYLLNFGHASKKIMTPDGAFKGAAKTMAKKLDMRERAAGKFDSRKHPSEYRGVRRAPSLAARAPLLSLVFAQLPVMMMWDDHEVDDDWNIDRRWKERPRNRDQEKMALGPLLAYEAPYAVTKNFDKTPDRNLLPRQNTVARLVQSDVRVNREYSCHEESVRSFFVDRRAKTKSVSFREYDVPARLFHGGKTLAQKALPKSSSGPVIVALNTPLIAPISVAWGQSLSNRRWYRNVVDRESLDVYRSSLVEILEWLPDKALLVAGDVHYGYQRNFRYEHGKGVKSFRSVACSAVSNKLPWYLRPILSFDSYARGGPYVRLLFRSSVDKHRYLDVLILVGSSSELNTDRFTLLQSTVETVRRERQLAQRRLSLLERRWAADNETEVLALRARVDDLSRQLTYLSEPYDYSCSIHVESMGASYTTKSNFAELSNGKIKLHHVR